MQLSSASITSALTARAVPVSNSYPGAGKRLTASATIGGSTGTSYPLADIAYTMHVLSTSSVDQFLLNLLLCAGESLSGSPEILPVDSDFTGTALPPAAIIYGLRFVSGSENTDVITAAVTIGGIEETLSILPGEVKLFQYPSQGRDLIEFDNISLNFNASGDSIILEVLAQTAP